MPHHIQTATLALACCGLATTALADLRFGQAAEDEFAALHAQLNGEPTEHYLDFESVPAGTNLLPGQDPFGVGARFASIINTSGTPFGPEHVEVSSAHHFSQLGNTIVGSPFQFGSDDGRVGYEIRFDQAQRRAGLLRAWNTAAITRFYNAEGVLLAQHQNTESWQFVGWIAGSEDQSQWVARIVMDGTSLPGTTTRQVGYSDDLYFGQLIPSPATGAMLLAGLGLAARRRR